MTAISNDMQAILTGSLLATVIQEQARHRQGNAFMAVTDVRPEVDEAGNYTNTFFVTFESGLVLSVSVNEVTEIPEQP